MDLNLSTKIAEKYAYNLTMEYIRQNNLFKNDNPGDIINASTALNNFKKIYTEFFTDLMNESSLLEDLSNVDPD